MIKDLISKLVQEATEEAEHHGWCQTELSANKAENEQTITDAKAAQTAVEAAMAVMKDFYAKSAEATALSQVLKAPADDAPETFDKPYTGLLPEGGNVVDFLEVILSDFSRLESETSAQESTENEEYKAYMFESEKDQALKQSALHSAEEELTLTQQALSKAVTYFEKLKPTCVDSGITHEERVKRREAEMQSLQEALKILAGTDVDVA